MDSASHFDYNVDTMSQVFKTDGGRVEKNRWREREILNERQREIDRGTDKEEREKR